MPSLFFPQNGMTAKTPVFAVTPKEVLFTVQKSPQNKAPPRHTRFVTPAEQAWLNNIIRQLAYDEYMQAKRERWLWERPPKTSRED